MPKRGSCGSILLAPRPPSRSPPTYDPHSTRCTAGATLPRLRALALFGRRPPQRVDSLLMPASENLHRTGSRQIIRFDSRHAIFDALIILRGAVSLGSFKNENNSVHMD